MTGRRAFAGWCRNRHLVEASAPVLADGTCTLDDTQAYAQTCDTCGGIAMLDRLADNAIGKPLREYAVFAALPSEYQGEKTTPVPLGPCASRAYISAALALRYAEPGETVALMCPHDREHDLPMMACERCRTETPSAALTVIVPASSEIVIEFDGKGGAG